MAGLAILELGGCSEETLGPNNEITPEVAEAVATFLVEEDGTAGWSASVVTEGLTGTREFSRSVDCPAGGERSVQGTGDSSLDTETRVLSVTWSTIVTHDACAFQHTRRDRTVTSVIDGSVTAAGAASYQLPEERRRPRTLLSYEASRVGSMTTTIGDRTRTCEIDIQESYDPETGAFEVTGTVCGRTVDITRTRGSGRPG